MSGPGNCVAARLGSRGGNRGAPLGVGVDLVVCLSTTDRVRLVPAGLIFASPKIRGGTPR